MNEYVLYNCQNNGLHVTEYRSKVTDRKLQIEVSRYSACFRIHTRMHETKQI